MEYLFELNCVCVSRASWIPCVRLIAVVHCCYGDNEPWLHCKVIAEITDPLLN